MKDQFLKWVVVERDSLPGAKQIRAANMANRFRPNALLDWISFGCGAEPTRCAA